MSSLGIFFSGEEKMYIKYGIAEYRNVVFIKIKVGSI